MAENIALRRIEKLLDPGSFVELGASVTARITDFTLKSQAEPSDGVITGYGQIDGNPVFVYSQNREVLNGTIGEMHAKKIRNLYDKAMRTDAPVIGLIDSGGFRLQESVDALDAFGKILEKQMECSGRLLMVSAVLGGCAGGMTMIPALSDFTFMSREAKVFVNAPHTITDNPKLAREYAADLYQSEVSGLAEVLDTEDEVLARIRTLVLMLQDEGYGTCDESELNRYVASGRIVENKDTRALLNECADDGTFLEIRPDYYPEMVTGFLKLNGILVGVTGNAAALYDEDGNMVKELPQGLTAGGCGKAADFLEYLSRMSIPVLTVSQADGFAPVEATEQSLPNNLARMTRTFSERWEPRVHLIIGDTYGSAYAALNVNSSVEGAKMTLAWDGVKVGMMPAEKAANILFADDEAKEKLASSYEEKQNSVWSAAARGSVDAVIEPKDTRKHLIMAFSML